MEFIGPQCGDDLGCHIVGDIYISLLLKFRSESPTEPEKLESSYVVRWGEGRAGPGGGAWGAQAWDQAHVHGYARVATSIYIYIYIYI